MSHSVARSSSCLAMLLSLLAIACERPTITYGERSVTIRPARPPQAGEGGAAGELLGGAAGVNGAAGSVAIDPPAGGMSAVAPDPIDAGMAEPPIDAGEPLPPFSFCPPVAQELLEPGSAGDGTVSGCPTKICESSLTIENTDLSVYLPVNGLAAMAAHYEGCTQVNGDVLINFTPESDLEKLSCLERVDGSLVILNTSSLEDLDGLQSLLHVSGDLRIARLEDTFADANSLTDIDALAKLRAVGGTLALRTPYVTTLAGLRGLRAIGDDFVIDVPVELENLSGARGLLAIGGDLRIVGTYRFTSLYGLQELVTIGGSLELSGSAAIPVFHEALPEVTCIGRRITIEEPNLWHEELDLLPKLERVGGMVSIKRHPWLRSVTMLKNVTHIAGSLQVHGNESLDRLDLSSLRQIDGFLWVIGNPLLEECPLIELADSLGAGGMSQIYDNSRALSPDCRMTLPTPTP